MTPNQSPTPDLDPLDVVTSTDELAEQRARHSGVPHQRPRAVLPEPDLPALPEPDREDYELRLDAYEVQLENYRRQLDEYARQLEVAHHDGLTGAWLRPAGYRLLKQELTRTDRQCTPLSIAFVDVDGLKSCNDLRGHAAGDDVLVAVAQALVAGLRGYDHVVRWGGDEFLCIMPGLREPEAVRRMEQSRAFLASRSDKVSISVGVAERTAPETAEELVTRADRALYLARGRPLA